MKLIMNDRRSLLAAMLGVTAVAAAGFGWAWSNARAASSATQDNLADVRRLASQINRLRQAPAATPAEASFGDDFTAQIESAAAAAGLPANQLLRVEPLPRVRETEGSDYLLAPTRLEFEGSPLGPLLTLLQSLLATDPSLDLSAVRLSLNSVNPTSGQGERWDAELTLTRRLFQPK